MKPPPRASAQVDKPVCQELRTLDSIALDDILQAGQPVLGFIRVTVLPFLIDSGNWIDWVHALPHSC
jgi:hypothetical protein